MLNEGNKKDLIGAARHCNADAMAKGPVGIIDAIIAMHNRMPQRIHDALKPDMDNLKENRKEAEQLIAGVLGMM